jgi:hypothetical protein
MSVPTVGPPDDPLKLANLVLSATFSERAASVTYNVTPALRVQNNATVIQFTLVSTANDVDVGGSDLLARIDGAHEALIRAFETMTSENAKRFCGRET